VFTLEKEKYDTKGGASQKQAPRPKGAVLRICVFLHFNHNHPANAEFIYQRTKKFTPKRFLKFHCNHTAFFEFVECGFDGIGVVQLYRNGHSIAKGCWHIWRYIRKKDGIVIAICKTGVHYKIFRSWRQCVTFGWRYITIPHYPGFNSERFLVKRDCFCAVPIEIQIRRNFHYCPPKNFIHIYNVDFLVLKLFNNPVGSTGSPTGAAPWAHQPGALPGLTNRGAP
jgi:hypothetical protein